MGVTRDDGIDLGTERRVDCDDRSANALAAIDRQRAGDPPFVQQHDDRLDAAPLQTRHQPVGGLCLVEESVPGNAGRRNQRAGVFQRHADESDLHALDALDPIRRQGRAATAIQHVGSEPLEVRTGVRLVGEIAAVDRMAAAVLHAQQLGHSFVELVIADARHVEAQRVQRLDRRFVMKQPGECRRTPNQVASGNRQCMLVPHPQLSELGCKVLGTTGGQAIDSPGRVGRQMSVVIVESQQLQIDQESVVARGTPAVTQFGLLRPWSLQFGMRGALIGGSSARHNQGECGHEDRNRANAGTAAGAAGSVCSHRKPPAVVVAEAVF